MSDDWPHDELKREVLMIMSDKQGPTKPPEHYFPRAHTIRQTIEKSLNLQSAEPPRHGAIVKAFLQAAITAADPERKNKDLNSARELLEFSAYKDDEIKQKVFQDQQAFPPKKTGYSRHSKKVRRYLAILQQNPNSMSIPTASKREKDIWAPAVVRAIKDFLHDHRDGAETLARELNLVPTSDALKEPREQATSSGAALLE